jgi:Na+/citrate or Na+/malate symporter
MRVLRHLLVDSDQSLYRWSLTNAYATGAAVTVAASVTGGLDSPVVMFTIVIGVMTSMLFAHQHLWNLYPIAIIAVIAAIDWRQGSIGDTDLLVSASACLVALSVPGWSRTWSALS